MPDEQTVEDYRPNPLRSAQHRADCTDFHCKPEDAGRIGFRGPNAVLHAIEDASERSGRTFNEQMKYVVRVCRGELPLSVDDERTEADWRALLGQLELCFDDEGDQWYPCAAILKKPREAPRVY